MKYKLCSLLIICILFVGCSKSDSPKYSYHGTKDSFSDNEIELCEKALDVIDSYMSLDIEADEAKEKLSIVLSQIYDEDDFESRTYSIGYNIYSVKKHIGDDLFLDSIKSDRDSISQIIEIEKNGYRDLSEDNIKKLDSVFDILTKCKDGKLTQSDAIQQLSNIKIKVTDKTTDALYMDISYAIEQLSGTYLDDVTEEFETKSLSNDELRKTAENEFTFLKTTWITGFEK